MSLKLLLILCAINAAFVCSQNELTFLGSDVVEQNVPLTVSIPEQVVESIEFVAGFNSGLSLFSGLPHENSCTAENEKLANDLVAVFNLVKNINKDTDFTKLISDILAELTDVVQNIQAANQDCNEWINEVEKVFNGIIAYVSDKDYVQKLTFHTLTNIGNIKDGINAGVELIKNGNFYDSGNKFGATTKTAFFWDFKL